MEESLYGQVSSKDLAYHLIHFAPGFRFVSQLGNKYTSDTSGCQAFLSKNFKTANH